MEKIMSMMRRVQRAGLPQLCPTICPVTRILQEMPKMEPQPKMLQNLFGGHAKKLTPKKTAIQKQKIHGTMLNSQNLCFFPHAPRSIGWHQNFRFCRLKTSQVTRSPSVSHDLLGDVFVTYRLTQLPNRAAVATSSLS